MNGLEAIELMKQGKMVKSSKHYPHFIDLETGKMKILITESSVAPAVNFDINYEGYEEYIEPKPSTGWERVGQSNHKLHYISPTCEIMTTNDDCLLTDQLYENAHYFSTKEKAEEINFKQTLFRQLQRFSDENGGNEIDWNDDNQIKYCITYDSKKKRVVPKIAIEKQFGQVYFRSFKAAQEAIRLFHDELIKYFTHDFGGSK